MKLLTSLIKVHTKDIFVSRGRVFVWWSMSVLLPVISLFFWRGAYSEKSQYLAQIISLGNIESYYLVSFALTSFMVVHPEDGIIREDIKAGGLVRHLLKPINILGNYFIKEYIYRLMQLCLGIFGALAISQLLHISIKLLSSISIFLFGLVMIFIAQLICFTLKLALSASAFWMYENESLRDVLEICLYLFSGTVAPLVLYPPFLSQIIWWTPFPYIVYVPVAIFSGIITPDQYLFLFLKSLFWLIFGWGLMTLSWKKGLKIFTGAGI